MSGLYRIRLWNGPMAGTSRLERGEPIECVRYTAATADGTEIELHYHPNAPGSTAEERNYHLCVVVVGDRVYLVCDAAPWDDQSQWLDLGTGEEARAAAHLLALARDS